MSEKLEELLSKISDKEQQETDEYMMMCDSFADMALEYVDNLKFTTKIYKDRIAGAYYEGMKTAYDLYGKNK